MFELFKKHLSSPWKIYSSLAEITASEITNPEFQEWRKDHWEVHDDCIEINFALAGKAAFGYNGKVYELTPGCAFLAMLHDQHDTGYSISDAFYYCCIHFYIGYIYWEIFELKGVTFSSLNLHAIKDFGMGWWFHDTLENLKKLNLTSRQKVEFLENLFGCLRLRLLADFPITLPKPYPAMRDRIINTMKLIEESHGRLNSAELLAQSAGYSKFHFLRLFKQVSGKSFREYLNMVRLSCCRALLNQGVPLKTIASEIGFSSSVALIHWMKKYRENSNWLPELQKRQG